VRSFRLTLAYDGTDFSGSQVQPDQRTVQGELEAGLGKLSSGSVRALFAGRTDSGVHAIGQIAMVRSLEWTASEEGLQRALNAYLPDDLVATNVVRCSESFHPRFDALWREYRYWIAPGLDSPFLGRYAWTTRADVDPSAVSAGATRLVGTHDFASFASGGEGVPWSPRAARPRGTTRTVFVSDCRELATNFPWHEGQPTKVLEVRVVADAFLPRMVRNIVGALVEVGQGRRDPGWISELLAARDRRLGSVVAPPQGLTLWRVGFDGDVIDYW
jgi:tRNA pseudouridine38-40 synthase